MNETALLTEAFGRIQQVVHRAVDGLDDDQLARRIDDRGNSIAWLVWHLSRIQDDHVAAVADHPQAWHASGWADRFDLPFDPDATGYGHGSDDVAAVRASAGLLLGYYDAVQEQTIEYLRGVSADDLDRVVDENWDPPVTLGVRLISVLADDLQHAGQAAFIRGLL
jgi:uncharacterized damage-inducible protein DinB